MKVRRIQVLVILLGLAVCLIPFRTRVRSGVVTVIQILKGRKTVGARVAEFGDAVRNRLAPSFEEIGVAYPPGKIILVGLKEERVIEVWVANDKGEFLFLKSYPILAASGTAGPKLAERDGQVPEGLYGIESLNPNSQFHLAMRVNYPNGFDKAKGRLDGRVDLGSDIMIHGKATSIGCLAMGDPAAEDLFVLAAETGLQNIEVILSPVDLRRRGPPSNMSHAPAWTPELYAMIQKELMKLTRHQLAAPNPAPPPR